MSPQTVLPMPTKEFLLQKKKEHEQALALQKYKDDEFVKKIQNIILRYIKEAIEKRGYELVMDKKYMKISLIDTLNKYNYYYIHGHS
jgi:Skp family chaperone for outer membrane proteins